MNWETGEWQWRDCEDGGRGIWRVVREEGELVWCE